MPTIKKLVISDFVQLVILKTPEIKNYLGYLTGNQR